MKPIRLALVGLGKIARDQHLPAIAATPGIALVAVASRNARLDGVDCVGTVEELLAGVPDVDAIVLCTPPMPRRDHALAALAAGKHVLLEKPPGAGMSELAPLMVLAEKRGRTLFAAWHSRFAPAVEPAHDFLAPHRAQRVTILWKEDARVWHPGRDWIFEPGGLGVFDPGINALSILPEPVFVVGAKLDFPANREAPIAAELELGTASGLPIHAAFDFRQSGEQIWSIAIETDAGSLVLSAGGARLNHDGQVLVDEPEREYRGVYRRFVELVRSSGSDADTAPLALVADAFMLGQRSFVDDFAW